MSFRRAARLGERRSQIAREMDRHRGILLPMEGPDGDAIHFRYVLGLPRATDRHGGGEDIGMLRDRTPGTDSAQRLSGDIDSRRVDGLRFFSNEPDGLDEHRAAFSGEVLSGWPLRLKMSVLAQSEWPPLPPAFHDERRGTARASTGGQERRSLSTLPPEPCEGNDEWSTPHHRPGD